MWTVSFGTVVGGYSITLVPTTTTTAVFVAVAVAVDMLAEAKWAPARARMEVKDESRMVEVMMMVWVGR